MEKYRDVLLARDLAAALRPGATAAQLAEFKGQWPQVPAEFLHLYELFNGQDIEELPINEPRWLALEEIPGKIQEWREFVLENFGPEPPPLFTDEAIQGLAFCPSWLPFMEDEDGSLYCLDFAPGPKGQIGQVIFVGLDRQWQHFDLLLEAPTFARWLEDLTATYMNDDFRPFPAVADYFQRQYELGAPLNGPALPAELNRLARHFALLLPDCFTYFYGLFNGYGQDFLGGRWLPLAEIIPTQQRWQRRLESLAPPAPEPQSRTQFCRFHSLWLPVYEGEKGLICLDFAPAPDGNLGQVISLRAERDFQVEWEEESLADYLESLLDSGQEPLGQEL